MMRDPEFQAQMLRAQMAARQRQAAPPPGQMLCVNCVNTFKLALNREIEQLKSQNVEQDGPEWQQALMAAEQEGRIPPVRPGQMMVNGTSCCMQCFPATKQTSLITAGPGWTPSGLPPR